MIRTTKLHLLIVERRHIAAFLRHRSELATLLQVTLPESWPQFPEAFSLPADDRDSNPALAGWHGYFFIDPQAGVLVGNGGFKGPPDPRGTVEIGYEIASDYWNRGFATEAVQGLLDYAFAHEDVQTVMAHTLAEINASNRVLHKVGMRFVAELDDPEVGKIWRWQISRGDYRK